MATHAGPIYGLSSDLRISYVNSAWFHFAAENGAEQRISSEWTLGRSVLDSMAEPLRSFCEVKFRECLRTGVVWTHEYDCSSAERYRRFHQLVYRVDDGRGLLVVDSRVVDRPHRRSERPCAPDEASYQDEDGLICQCMHCRRVQHPREVDRWDWIPAWVTGFPRTTSHGLCPTCFRFHYPVGRSAAAMTG